MELESKSRYLKQEFIIEKTLKPRASWRLTGSSNPGYSEPDRAFGTGSRLEYSQRTGPGILFLIPYMCGTRAEIVLICFSELELEVLGRSIETLNTGNVLPFLSPYQEWAYIHIGGMGILKGRQNHALVWM